MPFEDPGHLPHHRDGKDLEPERLPRQRRGTAPQMHGRYPDYDVLAAARHWDEQTRRVVLARLDPPPYRYFDEVQARTLEAFCDIVTGQDGEPRIPVLRFVDDALWAGRLPGYRYDGMPPDGEAWQRIARGLDEVSGGGFAEPSNDDRCRVVERFASGDLQGGVWETMPVRRAWQVATAAIVTAYYAHPWSWNEIGFGGPAYPRGYARLGIDQPEAWEVREAEGLGRAFQDDVDQDAGMRP